MKCFRCKKNASLDFDSKKVCNSCFIELIEKRVRKEIRINRLISRKDKIVILDDGTERSRLNEILLKNIIKDPTVSTTLKKIKSFDPNKIVINSDKVVIPWSLDDEIEHYMEGIFKGKNHNIISENIISPVIVVTKKEARDFLDIKKIKYEPSGPVDKEMEVFIDNIDKKYAGTRFSISKSIKALR